MTHQPSIARPRFMEALYALGAVLTISLTLGWFGPSLDAQDASTHSAAMEVLYADGTVARLDAEARRDCARQRGENSGVVLKANGATVCTDKHGRSHK